MGLSYINAIAACAAMTLVGAMNAAGQAARPALQPVRAHSIPVRAAGAGYHGDFMTLTLSGGTVNFNLTPGSPSNPGNGSIGVNLSWACPCDAPSFELYAYFTSPEAALTDGTGDSIPPSAILISDNGSPFQRLSGNHLFGGPNAGLHLVSIPATGGPRGGSHTDLLNFNIDLSSGNLPRLPPGTYTGTLTIQGQAQ